MDWTFSCFLIASLLLGLLVTPWDRRRIRTAVRRMGGTVKDLEMGAYDLGWLAGFSSEPHQLEYRDEDGALHLAEVKTSLVGGVSFVSDLVMPQARFLRKSPRVPAAAMGVREAACRHSGFPSGLPVVEARKPRPKMARME